MRTVCVFLWMYCTIDALVCIWFGRHINKLLKQKLHIQWYYHRGLDIWENSHNKLWCGMLITVQRHYFYNWSNVINGKCLRFSPAFHNWKSFYQMKHWYRLHSMTAKCGFYCDVWRFVGGVTTLWTWYTGVHTYLLCWRVLVANDIVTHCLCDCVLVSAFRELIYCKMHDRPLVWCKRTITDMSQMINISDYEALFHIKQFKHRW